MARDRIATGGPALPAAVLFDALGTLVELEPPWPHLARELEARGVVVSEEAARAAMLAEMAYYRAHHDEAGDWAGLVDLRRRCAAVVQEHLGTALALDHVLDALLAAIRFSPYPEVPGVLARLRADGARLAVVSNWDVSLHEVLVRTDLAAAVDGAVSSAEVGAAKPDPAIF
ncbi:MAG TPA: HAD family hydrolase, partial [Solirubrobacteraceae bacterium]